MAFSLWGLLEAALLVVNAVCILHEKRFLAKFGWSSDFVCEPASAAKSQLLNVVHSTRAVMRIPLIFVNTIVIVKELILG